MRVCFGLGAMVLLTQLFSFEVLANDKDKDKKMKEKVDFYESVASQKYVKRNSFPQERISVRKLPAGPVFEYNGSAPFKRMEKIDSLDDVKKAIADLRKKYEPFMRDLAPSVKSPRHRLYIKKMQFRYETPEDRADFNYTLSGKGEWKKVDIPYYHGPQGRATALYRAVVDVDKEMLSADIVMLHFNGADYYCDVSVNGHHIGSHEGMLDPFEFDAKPYLKVGENIIVVKLGNDYSMLGSEGHPRKWGNKIAASNSPGWDDPMHGWNCCIAGFGIYQDLYFETRSFASIADIFPRPMLKKKSVEVWVECDLPDGERAGEFTLETSIYGQNFKATVAKNVSKKIKLAGGRCLSKQIIKIPDDKLRLWTPDSPWLYQLQVSLRAKNGKKVLDAMARQFGMRSFVISTQSTPKGRMYLNGEEIRLRGTNTMGFLQKDVMAHDWDRLIDDLLMAKVTNMNFIRTTQRSVQAEVYDYADRLGMMMQSDLPLFGYINNKQFNTAIVQVGRMERLLRSHPSVILISYLNESMSNGSPISVSRAEFEKLFDAADIFVHHENPDRAVKYVDGDYQSPNKGLPDNHCYNIWYHGHGGNIKDICRGSWCQVKKGWMYGCGEFGAEGLDSVELMLKYYPPQWLPKDKNPENPWTPKLMKTAYKSSQTGNMSWRWFEQQTKMADWVRESRQHQAWGVKLITQAFRRMPRMNTFAVHLFIDAWPNGWLKTIVDTDRVPKPAWYVFRDALAPLAVQIRTDKTAFFSGEKYNTEIWVCNDTHKTPDAVIKYQVEKDGKTLESGSVAAKIPSVTEGSEFQGYLPITAPDTDKRTKIVVRIGLFDKKTGKQIHEDTQTFDIYPRVPAPKNKTAYLVGESNADAKELIEGFHLKQTDSPDENTVIIITDYKKYDAERAAINDAIKNGATAIALCDIPKKNARICGCEFKSKNNTKTWFVGRAKKHPAMKGTTSVDFKYLYSSGKNAPKQHNARIFESKELNPVLVLKQGDVVAEKNFGKGRLVVYQLDLAGRLCNPAIKTMLYKLLFQTAENTKN